VITESDVGENYEVDPVLQGVCEQSVSVLCAHVSPGEGRFVFSFGLDNKCMV
jgi:Cysteine rich repeat